MKTQAALALDEVGYQFRIQNRDRPTTPRIELVPRVPEATPSLPRVSGRADHRYPASAIPAITGARISPGEPVALVDISSTGISVECERDFAPGLSVAVIFDGSFSPRQVKARVVRCHVSRIVDGSLRFVSGLMFETRLDLSVVPAVEPPAMASANALVPNRW